MGRAASPAWSPDGGQIAFIASPASVGSEGQSRTGKPWNLYVMDSQQLQPRRVVSNIHYATSVSWSPDGTHLAFGGGLDGHDQGVHLVDLSTNKVTRVTSVGGQDVTWAPDGRKLVMMVEHKADTALGLANTVTVIDLP
jgi:Tol biopolymer transport system component